MTIKSIRIEVKVLPKSSKRSIVSYENDLLKVKLTSAPEKGKANKELLDFLSKALKIKKSSFSILRGQTSPLKLLELQSVNLEIFLEKLENYFKSS